MYSDGRLVTEVLGQINPSDDLVGREDDGLSSSKTSMRSMDQSSDLRQMTCKDQ